MKRGFGILVLAIFVLSICILAGPLRAVAVEGASGQSAVVSNAPISLQTNAVSSSQSVDGAVNPEQASSNQGGTLEEETTVPEEDNQSSQPLVSAQLPENEANKAPISKSPAKASAQSAFHASIPFNKDTYSAGSTAICTVKYDIDRGAINEGDTIAVTIPTDIASKVSFSVDPLHFKSVSDKGNGVWELTLGSNAQTALTGSFSMYITTADVAQETTEPVTVGNASKTFTVVPTGQPGGVGQATDVINKDAPDDKVSFGDYDYSEGYGDNAAQIGIFDSSSDQTIGYRLIVNDKRISMDNISVTDTLPDGMIFDRTHPVKVVDSNGGVVDSSLYSVSMSGQTMVFSYPGTLADPVWVY